jgi:hypothetical protein
MSILEVVGTTPTCSVCFLQSNFNNFLSWTHRGRLGGSEIVPMEMERNSPMCDEAQEPLDNELVHNWYFSKSFFD